MTAYQRKRQILNKLNARTMRVSRKYGVDRKLIAEQAIDGLDGVYIDTTYNTINITPGFESEELYKALEDAVLTGTGAEIKAMDKYKDFIGPLQDGTVAREVKAMYEYTDEIADIIKDYYELEASIKQAPWTEPKQFRAFEKQLSDIGKQWHGGVPYSKLQGLLETVKKLRGEFK